jgi:uncharacterized protein (TIGR02453 family)
MLSIKTFDFLKDLEKNNNREWFALNKKRYDNARADVETMIGELLRAISEFDTEAVDANPKKCLFRIYRDTRFSANKEPYKLNMGAILRSVDTQNKFDHADYYVHVKPQNSFVSCGLYMPSPKVLKELRIAIYEDFDSFSALINKTEFVKTFGALAAEEDVLQRVPTGFDKNHPSAEYLKMKHFYVFKMIKDEEMCSNKFIQQAVKILSTAQYFKNWINKVIENIV